MAVVTGADNKLYTDIDQSDYKRAKPIENPAGTLGSQEFLALFIETLKNQSLDSTTDIKEIMDYTASMTTVETNNANRDALENVVTTLTNNSNYSSQYGLLPSIGRLVVTNQSNMSYDGRENADFSLFMQNKAEAGSLLIKDALGNTIKTIALDKYSNSSGTIGVDEDGISLLQTKGLKKFSWDGTLANGIEASAGSYRAEVDYADSDGRRHTSKLGEYLVQSVKFKEGKPYLNVGDFDVKFDDVIEIRDLSKNL